MQRFSRRWRDDRRLLLLPGIGGCVLAVLMLIVWRSTPPSGTTLLLAGIGAAIMGLWILLFGLAGSRVPETADAGAMMPPGVGRAAGDGGPPEGDGPAAVDQTEIDAMQARISAARQVVETDPRKAARIFKYWLGADVSG